ncbi:energy-coupling factor transport system ATP-binding protein [Microbacterium trichothecenolyticum]|uniref:ATP-binding cassette domain-containing protein n=1 Tax=Microbacterium trichothecenolyticum TaxID=69370 RepID=UPI0028669CE0|nr:ATP-binding cassette domain-containing protein [Microbacterium trichothecenolyticum]MDR7183300.1 energy-coupling factor transport system ATP-binding protein [Microbacterium trichothecenolyticum]
MTFRPGPLRAAAILAAGFVAARVVYRILFHGADGDGFVLLDLPAVRLPSPFAHVVLLGPVTVDGLWDAAASALPIALTILAFGVVNALVDLHRVFARASRRGPLRGVARALAIAAATLPSLADGARAVRFAQRLRGERGGARMLLPLLERTLERAGAVAAALELRGFAGRGLDGDCLAPVQAEGVEIGFGDGTARRGIRLPSSLALPAGTLTLVAGPTGSGKSTLLRAVAGLHTHTDGGWIAGSLQVVGHERATVPPRDLAQRVGVVLQHPRDAFATERVRDEIALPLELRGVAPVLVTARVAEIADRVGATALLDRPTRGLSAGEATLVAIAAAIVEHPILMLVDEPLADLDADARVRIAGLLDSLAHEAGMCVVVAEHRVDALAGIADTVLRIDGGAIAAVEPDEPGSGRTANVRGARDAPRTHGMRPEPGTPVLHAREITVRHGDAVAVAGADVELRAGEIVALVGPNGAGKSSLLAALALPARGTDIESAGRVALVPDASDDLFVSDTVAAECRRADRRAGRAEPAAAIRFAGFLGLDPDGPAFAARMSRHPRDLSAGERRCLALAIQLAGAPRVLLVDEPTRGLDPAARDLVWAALDSLAATGTAVLVATHEPEFAARADGALSMNAGVLTDAPFVTQDERAAAAREARNSAGAQASRSNRPELRTPERPHRPSSRGRDLRESPRVDDLAPTASPSVTQDRSLRPSKDPQESGPVHSGSANRPELRTGNTARRRRRLKVPPVAALAAANLVALGAFCWPLVATAVPEQAYAAVPIAALALVPLAALVVVATLDGSVRSAHMLALLGTLAAIGAAVRIAGTGVGGVEAVFILLILAGRAYGARFGMLLGMATIALSTLITGTFGPWTPFQMFACAWVGAIAGLLPRRISRVAEIAMLSVYGVVASYAFGLLMNLWFWPFAVGYGTGISYDGSAPLDVNLSSFLLYSLVTSTLSWDTLRAITTVIGLVVVGRPILAALRRTKPLATRTQPVAAPRERASALS